ncbi:unnamed protein product [Symbiodinium natans]|uniref:Major facilitator superfamily (MFS) profile domain-containing protein n=1 Tax=Symbiodinium natans TaxID=878477 RepID=A0A812QXH9_9DINO|nr:unnamed protein product [Symbiodinium natans]
MAKEEKKVVTEEELQANVWKLLWYNGIFSVFSSIAQLGLFDTYLFIMAGDSNTAVGWAESISGLSQIVLAGPAGILSDTMSRSKILQWCAYLSVLAVAVSVAGVSLDNFPVIYVSLFLFGTYTALQNTASFALYSDSIPQGSRAKWLSRISIVNQLGYGAGPFLSLFLLAYFGNEWKLSVLHFVLIIGFIGMIPANFFLVGLKDAQHEEEGPEASGAFSNLKYARVVPWLICGLDIITAVGAGMTVKFFPLFFKEDYGMNPGQIQLLFAVYGLSFGFFTWLCEKAAEHMGRVEAGLLFSSAGVVCLFLLAYLRWLPAVLVVFVIRGALANSIYPIDKSILMDFVPSSERGRWNAAESISSMSWSGSAVLGGYLMDAYDYRQTFVITGFIYAVAALMRLPLFLMVPRYEVSASQQALLTRMVSHEDVQSVLLASVRSRSLSVQFEL